MPKFKHGRNDIMAVGEHIRLNRDSLTDDSLDSKPAAIHLRLYILDHNARTPRAGQRAKYFALGGQGGLYAELDH
jgi:hypothetical protein